MNKRRGRPPKGAADARERLTYAAKALFVERGYHGTTLRAIGAAAGCDPALIAYHFGSKRALFAHVMTLALSPTMVLEAALPGERTTVGTRLLSHVMHAWDQPEVAEPLGRLVQASLTDDEVMRAFREYVDQEVMGRLVEYFGGTDATERATALLTLVVGTIFARYVVKIPAIASQSSERYWEAVRPLAHATLGSPRPKRRPGGQPSWNREHVR